MRAKTSGAKAFIGCRASCPTFESIASDVGVETVFEISQDGERTKPGRIDLLTELQNIPRGSRAPKRQQARVPLWWRRWRFADALSEERRPGAHLLHLGRVHHEDDHVADMAEGTTGPVRRPALSLP